MKKIFLPLFFIACSGIFAQLPTQHIHPKSPLPPLKNEAVLLKGFDANLALGEAKKKSSIPAVQQEYFEALKRRYLAKKIGVQSRGNQSFALDYDQSTNTRYINLTPNNANCSNAGFENMTFANWTGDTYTNSTALNWNSFVPAWTPGIATMGNNQYPQAFWPGFTSPYPNRHTIMTIPPTINNPPSFCIGWDSIAINPANHLSDIEFVPATANGVTARLGNANNNFNETERLVYSLAVNSSNSNFSFSYAVIIYDGGHLTGEQPFFKITTRDQAGNPIAGCGQYLIDASMVSTDTSFRQASYYSPFNATWTDPPPVGAFNTSYFYKKWTTVSIDLSAYVGTTISLEFQTGDCIFGGHFCYAYIDATCQPAGATVNMCTGSSSAILVAPPGYTLYQWFGPNGMAPINGATNDSLVVSNATVGDIYTVSVISAAGCTTQMQTTLTTTNITIQNTFSTPSCLTGNSGTATVVAIGSNNGYNFAWTNTAGGGSIGGNTTGLTGLAPGTYSVIVSSPGCGSADTTITIGISPPIYYTDIQNFCISPAPATAPAGSGYVWYNSAGAIIAGANSAILNVTNPINNSIYTVVFNDPSGCRDSVKITLTQTVNQITQNTTFCGTTASLTVPAGATNTVWYDANWPYPALGVGNSINIANPIASPWQPYYVSYTNPITGCKDSVFIYLTNTPSAIYPSNISSTCLGLCTGSATLNLVSGVVGGYNLSVLGPNGYTFTNPNAPATQNLSALCAGAYTMSFTDGQCTATGSFLIDTIIVNVTASTPSDTICSGQQAIVTFTYGGSTPVQCGPGTSACTTTTPVNIGAGINQNTATTWPTPYGNWYSNEKYQILYNANDLLAAGMIPGKISSVTFNVASIPATMNTTFLGYSIKIGCTAISDLDPALIGFGVPFITGVTQQVWGPQNYVVVAGANTHNFTTSWYWDGVSNVILEICYTWVGPSTYTQNTIVNSTATPYNSFAVYYSDGITACPSTTSNAVYAQRPNTIFGTCSSIALPTDFTYNWSPNTGVSGLPPTVTLSPNVSTTYTLSITSNAGGCIKIDTIPLVVINPFVINMPVPVTYCATAALDTLNAFTIPAATNGVWSGNGITNAGNNLDGYFNPATAGIGSWYAYYTASSGSCTLVDSVQLIVNSGANAALNPAGPFCITDAAININPLNPGGVFTGIGITNANTGTFSPIVAGAGTTTIQYTFSGACPDSSTMNIIVYPQPIIAIASDITSGCNPTSISFTSIVPAPANGNAQWFFGDGFTGNSQNIIHSYQDTGSFSVTYIYTDINGCSDTATNNNWISIYPAVTAAFTANPNQTTIIDPTVYFTNQSVNATIYYWELTPTDFSILENPVFGYADITTYTVMLVASNQYGCIDTAYNTVIIDADVALYVPNAFTPGDDNILNDNFLPYISGIDNSSFMMEIYDRWGEKIFNSSDINYGWNGRKNNVGQQVQIDVYVWKIYFKDAKNKKYQRVGHVTVVK